MKNLLEIRTTFMRASQLREIKIASLPSRATIDRFSTFQSPINLPSAELRSEYFKNQAVLYKRTKSKTLCRVDG